MWAGKQMPHMQMGNSTILPLLFIPLELTYQEVLSFKPLEPSQLPGTHEIEQ